MAHQVAWNKIIYEEFLDLTYLSKFQRDVMDRHVIYKMTDLQIALDLHASESTVQKAIRECKLMYDDVQPYSKILPPRKKLKGIKTE